MNFGQIERYLLLGGAQLLPELSLKLKNQGKEVYVVTSIRHAQDKTLENSSLSEFCKTHGIPLFVSDNINTDPQVIGLITPKTLGISKSAAWVMKKDFIDRFSGKLVNLHPARLPQDRGGGGFSWMIMSRTKNCAAVIHLLTPEIDAGDIIKHREYAFPDSCRLPSEYFEHSLAQERALLEEFLDDVAQQKDFQAIAQEESRSTYWPRLASAIHGYIDWSWDLKDIESFIRAFDEPYIGAITFCNGKKIHLKKCASATDDGPFHPFQKGLVYKKTSGSLFIATGSGGLMVSEVLDEEGKDVMGDVALGDRFFTPSQFLEKAMQYRAVYTPQGLKETPEA